MVKPLVKERRTSIRTKRVLSIEYRLHKSKKGSIDKSWHLSTTQEIAAAGLSFYSDFEHSTDDILQIRVIMSGILDVFKGFGRVIRVERKRMGATCFVAVKLTKGKPQMRDGAVRRRLVNPKSSLCKRI